jgi:hypothetical protein
VGIEVNSFTQTRSLATRFHGDYMIQQHQEALGWCQRKKLTGSCGSTRYCPSRCAAARISQLAIKSYTGYLFLSDVVLDFFDEQLGRRSFTGEGGKGEEDGSCFWLEMEEKQLNGFRSRLFSESSGWLFGSLPTGEILSDSGRRQLQIAPVDIYDTNEFPTHGKKHHYQHQMLQ